MSHVRQIQMSRNVWQCLWFRIKLALYAILFVLFSRDKTSIQTKRRISSSTVRRERRLIFIRHAESQWNFLQKRKYHPFLLCQHLLMEFLCIFRMDSLFIDAPLSAEGEHQALTLKQQILPRSSLVVASNLRRTIHTAALSSDITQIRILSCLQEISRGLDSISLLDEWFLNSFPNLPKQYARGLELDLQDHHGNKPLFGTGVERLHDFAQWVFERQEESVTVFGHSLWFRSFFQEFCYESHRAKRSKIVNCGVISLLFQERIDLNTGKVYYSVPIESITTISGGYI